MPRFCDMVCRLKIAQRPEHVWHLKGRGFFYVAE